MLQPKISVVINTYNAAHFLPRILPSVKVFDEILVCDMESTDDTRALATAAGARVVVFPKGNHTVAEPARQFALQQARYDWVLVVDADEVVPESLARALYAHTEQQRDPSAASFVGGLWIPRRNRFMGRFMHGSYPDRQLRFFVREGTTWPPFANTMPTVTVGRTQRLPARAALSFDHLADDTLTTILEKHNRYSEGEIEKRCQQHFPLYALFTRPLFHFFKAYVIRGGWRDGETGLLYALLQGYYQFILVAKLRAAQSHNICNH